MSASETGRFELLQKIALFGVAVVLVFAGAYLWFTRGGTVPDSSGGPLALRRITQDQYKTIIADVFGADIKIGGRFEPDIRKGGLLAVGTSEITVTPAGFEQYDGMARTIAAQIVDEQHRAQLLPCEPVKAGALDEACEKQIYAKIGRLLYRRPLTDEEVAARVAVAKAGTDRLGDPWNGLAMSLAGLLESPNFLFRNEAAEPDPAHPGQLRLTGYAKATRLAFFLWNSTPDDRLLTAAEKGDLHTDAGLAREVDRLLASPRVEASLRAFFTDMLRFDAFNTLTKDTQLLPKFVAAMAPEAEEQTLRTITDHLLVQQADYRDLFTTRKTFLTHLLGTLYRVPVMVRDEWVPYEFPKDDPRAGILTQISFLALNSHPGRSSPTLRGKALREVLLYQKVPDPPGNVDFKIVQDVGNPQYKTARARLTAHVSDPTCAACHKIIDPIGLALENFDSAGEYRKTENGTPLDASGEIDGKAFASARDLGQAIHDHPETPTCLTQRLYAYAVGREPGAGEQAFVGWLNARFAASGYKMPELMRRIATSDAFYRVAMPAAQTAMSVAPAE